MKLVSYLKEGEIQLGAIVNEALYSLQSVNENLPKKIIDYFQSSNELIQQTEKQFAKIAENSLSVEPVKDFTLLAPVPRPTSCRDGYAFRQHVESARRNRGVEMIKEFDQYPIFYFTNHNAVQGPGDIYCMPDHFQQLDFELEVAIVIGKEGRNIKAKDADA
ncbi:MAG: fumarylacetoacetate hydrolase family protein, partial [Sediminibacterium sp.]